MSRPVSAPPPRHGKHAPLTTAGPVPAQADEPPTVLHLDALWHYDCVVSRPHSHAARCSPPSPAIKLQAAHNSPHVSADSRHAGHAHPRPAPLSVFNAFDANGDGTVSIHEICRIFEKLGLEYSLESLLACLVTTSHASVGEQEFLELYEFSCTTASSSTTLPADVEQDLLDAFHVFDKDGNGFITPDELQSVLCSFGFSQARKLDACVDMIARVDQNGDGRVDFFEFKKLFQSENPFIMITTY